MVRAGTLNRKISIQEATSASLKSTATGEFLKVWSSYTTSRWASVEPQSGNEFFSEQSRRDRNTLTFTLRHSSVKPINQGMRVIWEGNPYDITEIINPDDSNRLTVITAEIVK